MEHTERATYILNATYRMSEERAPGCGGWHAALAYGVIEDAMRTYVKCRFSPIGGVRDKAADIVRWVECEDDEHSFSFNNSCAQAGLSTDFMRGELLRIFSEDGFTVTRLGCVRRTQVYALIERLRSHEPPSPEALRAAIGVAYEMPGSALLDFSRRLIFDKRKLPARAMYVYLAAKLNVIERTEIESEFAKHGCKNPSGTYSVARNLTYSPTRLRSALTLLLKYAKLRSRVG